MAWLQLTVAVARDRVDGVSACLAAHDAEALSLSGADEEELLEPAPGAEPLWNRVRLQALLDPAVDLKTLRAELTGIGARLVDAELVADADWQSRWRAYAVRDCFAGRLWLLPRDEPFEPPAAVDGPAPAVLRLEPGLAFGSGSHATTRLCLEGLAALPLTGLRVLDYGCGSGVLALAAALLGASAVVAVDHDPQALLATRDNASYNQVGPERLEVLSAAAFAEADSGGFDVVVANILANPLVTLAGELTQHARPGGHVLLSGLLVDQERMIRDAYPEITFSAPAREAEWIRLDGRRRPS